MKPNSSQETTLPRLAIKPAICASLQMGGVWCQTSLIYGEQPITHLHKINGKRCHLIALPTIVSGSGVRSHVDTCFIKSSKLWVFRHAWTGKAVSAVFHMHHIYYSQPGLYQGITWAFWPIHLLYSCSLRNQLLPTAVLF